MDVLAALFRIHQTPLWTEEDTYAHLRLLLEARELDMRQCRLEVEKQGAALKQIGGHDQAVEVTQNHRRAVDQARKRYFLARRQGRCDCLTERCR